MLRARSGTGWSITPIALPQEGARRRRASAAGEIFPERFLADGVAIVDAGLAEPKPSAPSLLEVEIAPPDAMSYLLVARHPSGALTFHRAETPSARRAAADGVPQQLLFRVPTRPGFAHRGRRDLFTGVLTYVVKLVLLRIAKAAARRVVPGAVAALEAGIFQARGLREGLVRVTTADGRLVATPCGQLVPAASGRALILLHGTFSSTLGSFDALAQTEFFARVAGRYGGAIYGFDHLTVSKTPAENARALLSALPAGSIEYDVLTHSRGGLVLRNLVENGESLGAAGGRFRLGHAVLAACPNEGTPLATPKRWQEMVGWLTNLLDMFPDNPFTTALGFVSEAIVWIAEAGVEVMPGLASMQGDGEQLALLQGPPGPSPTAYSAIAANYRPDEAGWQRLVDMGVDAFFAGANDLVVPTEGGWRIDRSRDAIPAQRIACFGPGGNLRPSSGDVHHLNIMQAPETGRFAAEAFAGATHDLPGVAMRARLPDRRSPVMDEAAEAKAAIVSTPERPRALPTPIASTAAISPVYTDTFQLVVFDGGAANGSAQATPRRFRPPSG